MKAVLVIDMPRDCASGCPVMCKTRCINHRPTWCPLRPLPKKMNETEYMQKVYSNGDWYEQVVGWNACIDELLGEDK